METLLRGPPVLLRLQSPSRCALLWPLLVAAAVGPNLPEIESRSRPPSRSGSPSRGGSRLLPRSVAAAIPRADALCDGRRDRAEIPEPPRWRRETEKNGGEIRFRAFRSVITFPVVWAELVRELFVKVHTPRELHRALSIIIVAVELDPNEGDVRIFLRRGR